MAGDENEVITVLEPSYVMNELLAYMFCYYDSDHPEDLKMPVNKFYTSDAVIVAINCYGNTMVIVCHPKYACMHLCMCMCVGVWEFVCMYIHTYLYILYVLYIWVILLCYGGGGGGTVVSVYSFCIFYALLFDDFLQ